MPPDSRYWRQLYRSALSEVDKSKLPERIAEAEKAVVLRARELFQAAGDNGEETEALDDGRGSGEPGVQRLLHPHRRGEKPLRGRLEEIKRELDEIKAGKFCKVPNQIDSRCVMYSRCLGQSWKTLGVQAVVLVLAERTMAEIFGVDEELW
jgi:hypothetical protein